LFATLFGVFVCDFAWDFVVGSNVATGLVLFGDFPSYILRIVRRVPLPALDLRALSQQISAEHLIWYTQGKYVISGQLSSIIDSSASKKTYEHCVRQEPSQGFSQVVPLLNLLSEMVGRCDFHDQTTPTVTRACFMLHLPNTMQLSGEDCGCPPWPAGPLQPSFLSILQQYRGAISALKRLQDAGNLRVVRFLAENRPDDLVEMILAADCASMVDVARSPEFGFSHPVLTQLLRDNNILHIPGLYKSRVHEYMQRSNMTTDHPLDRAGLIKFMSSPLAKLVAVGLFGEEIDCPTYNKQKSQFYDNHTVFKVVLNNDVRHCNESEMNLK